ncbi:hypothetical protein [Vibrio sp. 1180_3]|uniref:hypothetical protein n=1 Tax=Vibrio sp. 1180_3 TaxID=2528832 RepID=UPI002405A422|nr:hypothetical protein [Vibrio sp. 1180_3]MDF9399135.1 hypothetical protein [Vibrio sp. 1180_3]
MIYKTRKQSGDALLATLMALVILIVISIMIAKAARVWQYELIAKTAVKRINTVHEAMQRAYIDGITVGTPPTSIATYPADATALISQGYLNDCTIAQENAGQCISLVKLPWVTTGNADQLMTIAPFIDPADNYPAFRITFSLAGIQPLKKQMIIRKEISQLPSYTEDASGNVTMQFTRPGSSIAQDNLVRRDGTTKMTNDWDYGNFDLNNVKYINDVDDISFKGVTDRTALTGSIKMGSTIVTNSSGKTITKPSCPVGYSPQIQVWTVSLGTTDLQYNVKNFAAWDVNSGANWKVYFRSTAENSSGTRTYFYQGVVGYATWCDFS